MITIPPYLKRGDATALQGACGFMPPEKAATCIETLEGWGYTVVGRHYAK